MSMSAIDDVVFVGPGARTPFGSFLGGLSRVSPTALGEVAAAAALERAGLPAAEIEALIFGNVLPTGKDTSYLARHIGLRIGVPQSAPALNVDRACGSSLEAIVQAAKSILVGEHNAMIAGGSENLSMTPYTMRGVRQGWKMQAAKVDDWLFTALHDDQAGCSIAQTVEHLAQTRGIDRARADSYAVKAQGNARRARTKVESEIATVTAGSKRRPTQFSADQNPRPESTVEGLAKLPGLFARDGVVSAGNSAGLTDGAAALVVTSASYATERELNVTGRLRAWATVGVAPKEMGIGPAPATRLALERAGWSLQGVDLLEINDSFAVQAIAVADELEVNADRLNPEGGAIALGHPLAATGARLVISCLRQLEARGGGRAIASLCIGGGQGMALAIEV